MDIRNYFKNRSVPIPCDDKEDEDMAIAMPEPTATTGSVRACVTSDVQQENTTKTPNSTQLPLELTNKGEPIKQIILDEYPKQSNNRCFRSVWYKQFKWQQYSVSKDAAFCYACMNFNKTGSKELAYTENGFRNWKNALDENRGFPKHESTMVHLESMKLWKEKEIRVASSSSVSTLVNDTILEKNRYYVKSIIEIVQFLAANELAFRGSYDLDEHIEKGLFNKLFEYTVKKDRQLQESLSIIPKNASYMSPEIQNSIVECMAEEVRKSVVEDVNSADVPWFTLLEDGTRDKNNRENIAIALRYVKEGQVKESVLQIVTTTDLDARTFTETTLQTLLNNGIDPSHMLSQCYDGASVMSGVRGGVAALMQTNLGKNIPYVHCYNHRLHLVLVKTISEIRKLKHFFEHCAFIHSLFHHPKVQAIYKGKTIVRLLEQRWSGHYNIIKVIFSNYEEIIRVLDKMAEGNENFDGEDIAKSVGTKTIMVSMEFRFCLCFCKQLLELLHPADAVLQAKKTSLKDGMKFIEAVTSKITEMRTDSNYTSVMEEAQKLIQSETTESNIDDPSFNTNLGRGKRKCSTSKTMDDFIVMEKLPSVSSKRLALNPDSEPEPDSPMKREFFETIDMVLSELDARFGNKEGLLLAISSIDEFDRSKLQPLAELGIALPSAEEMRVCKTLAEKRQQEEHMKLTMKDATEKASSSKKKQSSTREFKNKRSCMELLFPSRDAFKMTYQLLAAVETFGCSTATCESTFSALTAINRPQRLAMKHQRMANLVFLAFERKRTEDINIDRVLTAFNNKKDRRLQLF